jgi:geranylgeranyl diphosphate synthase, type II
LPAIGVEVFHNFTLMHDDIMDAAPIRRGQPTVHEKWNPNIAILSGDVMLVAAYELMLNMPQEKLPQAIKRFNRTAAEVCEGQQFDMNFSTRNDVTKAEYINMIRLKTAVLLGFALELGALVAGATADQQQLVNQIGVDFGIGFQLDDDILDVYGDPATFGKQVGGDIIENKKTYMLLDALEKAQGSTAKALNDWIAKTNFDATEKVVAVTAIYDELGIKQAAEAQKQFYFDRGFANLAQLEADSNAKALLEQFARALIERKS